MNRTATKKLRKQVLNDMGYEPNEQETAREIFRYPEFRKIFRARKKNFLAKLNSQSPVLNPGKAPIPKILLRKKLNKAA